MMTLSPELQKQIEREAEHYANVQHSDKGKHLHHHNSQRWDDSKDDWEAGAEHYGLKWEQAEARAERAEKALREIARQFKIDEMDANDVDGDISEGYDAIINVARQALTPKTGSDDSQ